MYIYANLVYSIKLFTPMNDLYCPKCKGRHIVKSGRAKGKQRYKCNTCNYHFSVLKEGKNISPYFVIKALQLHLEGVTFREIERILGVSHVSVMNWIRRYNVKAPENIDFYPTYKILTHQELLYFLSFKESLRSAGCIITEVGDKFMVIKWERYK